MSELLPGIDIAISVESSLFLERMIELGEQSGRFIVEHVVNTLGGRRMGVVNFRLQEYSPHEGHGFQLIARGEAPKRIQVEVRAQRWSVEPPTREIYVGAARELAGEVLRRYNRTFGTRYRLRIGVREGRPFKISDRTETLLHRFTVLANTSSLHSFDWERFYELVRAGRQQIPEHLLRSKLQDAGFSPARADHLSEIYQHLWEFKRRS